MACDYDCCEKNNADRDGMYREEKGWANKKVRVSLRTTKDMVNNNVMYVMRPISLVERIIQK